MAEPLTLGLAFGAGILSFLSPCIISLVPVYLGYISGTQVQQFAHPSPGLRARLFVSTLLFILGFSVIFLLIGFSSGYIGELFLNIRPVLPKIAGIVIAFFGLILLGFLKLPFLSREWRAGKVQAAHPFLFGLLFGLGWTPCIGIILGGIVVLAATQGVVQGLLLLGAYSLGLAIPFLIAALFIGEVIGRIPNFARFTPSLMKLAGGVFVVVGVALFFNWIFALNAFLFQLFDRVGITPPGG